MTSNFVDEINQIADNANNARLSNIQISSLNKISSSQNMISNLNYFPNTEKNENNNCYICKHCYIFPLIKIIDYNTIMLKCKDELNEKKTFYVMFNYRLKPITDETQKNITMIIILTIMIIII